MKRFNGLMALVAVLSFSAMSGFAVASDDKKEEKQEKGGHVVVFGDDKKEEHKDKSGHVVSADEPKDEKKDAAGK